MGGQCRQVGRVSVATPPSGLPVSIEQAKRHLRIEHPDEDQQLAATIAAAAGEIDAPHGWLGRSLLSRTLRLTLGAAPPPMLYLPGPPVTAISSVTYRNQDDAFVSIPAEDYDSDLSAEPALLWIGDDGWPSDLKAGVDCLRVDYVAGYASADAIPATIRQWILLRVGELYRDREASLLGVASTRLGHADRMLDNLRVRA